MSRVGKKPIAIPDKVKVSVKDGRVYVEGPKGKLEHSVHAAVRVVVKDKELACEAVNKEDRDASRFHGLTRALLSNMVKGVSTGYTRELEVNGVGYKAELAGDTLTLALGLSHPVVYKLPKSVTAKIEKNRILLSGYDRAILGQVAAELRSFRPPEPYKGKGVKYVEEVIKRKVGKAGA